VLAAIAITEANHGAQRAITTTHAMRDFIVP